LRIWYGKMGETGVTVGSVQTGVLHMIAGTLRRMKALAMRACTQQWVGKVREHKAVAREAEVDDHLSLLEEELEERLVMLHQSSLARCAAVMQRHMQRLIQGHLRYWVERCRQDAAVRDRQESLTQLEMLATMEGELLKLRDSVVQEVEGSTEQAPKSEPSDTDVAALRNRVLEVEELRDHEAQELALREAQLGMLRTTHEADSASWDTKVATELAARERVERRVRTLEHYEERARNMAVSILLRGLRQMHDRAVPLSHQALQRYVVRTMREGAHQQRSQWQSENQRRHYSELRMVSQNRYQMGTTDSRRMGPGTGHSRVSEDEPPEDGISSSDVLRYAAVRQPSVQDQLQQRGLSRAAAAIASYSGRKNGP